MFNHLHIHSHYSKLDGLSTVEEYLTRAKSLGMSALAITDHGTCSGQYDLFTLAPKYGIKPIYGCEFYFDNETEKKRNHLILLAKDNEGLRNIWKLQEWSYVHGFHGKPRINMEILRKHHKGIICTSACIANIIPRSLSEGDFETATFWAKEFKALFGEDFYLEVQDSSDHQIRIANQNVVKLAKKLDIKFIASTDVHYALKDDFATHDVMLCIQTNSKKDDAKRFRFPNNDFWMKSEDEMKLTELAPEDRKQALNETGRVADKCDATIVKGKYLPKFYDIPEGVTEERLLRDKVTQLYKERIVGGGIHTKEYLDDVKHELDVIDKVGFAGYFLVVADFIKYCDENNILVGTGRGSACGSKVSYITGITKIEPQKHHLLFGRFLDEFRIPDVDSDFSDIDAIFPYLQEKYGEGNVARIVAFGTLAPRAVIRRVMSVYNHPESIVAQIASCVPDTPKITLEKAYKASTELCIWKKKYPEEFRHIERLAGKISHTSQHAGGVVIYPNLSDYIPLHSDSDDRNKRVISFDKNMVEDYGFCKLDILGLDSLSVISRILNSIRDETGECIDFDKIDYNDSAIYKDICAGNLYGVFQLSGQVDYVTKQQPKCFDDLVAITSVVRPGTCDVDEYFERRRTKNYTIPPQEEAYMRQSEGLIIYQEQYELLAKTYAGWEIGFSDRRIRKNKNLAGDTELMDKFLTDALANGYSNEVASEVWGRIVDVAGKGYSFNLSHAVAYTYITYRMAWLKHYYPIHYYASILTKFYSDDKKKHMIFDVITECKKCGIKILPPDVNISSHEFVPTKDGIRYAISAVKGLGGSAFEHLCSLRPIASLEDMIARAQRKYLKENVVDSMIKAGCFGDSRYDILLEYKSTIKSKKEVEKKSDGAYEMDSIGIYLSEHPMDKYSFKHITEYQDDKPCLVGGIVKKVEEKNQKNGKKMAFIQVESNTGLISCLCFATNWTDAMRKKFKDGNIVMIKGKRSKMSCLINEVKVIEQTT